MDHLLQSTTPFYRILLLRSFNLDTQNQYLLLKLEVFSLASKNKRTGVSWLFCAVSVSGLPEKKISNCFCSLIKCRHLSVLKWIPLSDMSYLFTPCKFLLKKHKITYFSTSSLSSGTISFHCFQEDFTNTPRIQKVESKKMRWHLLSIVFGICIHVSLGFVSWWRAGNRRMATARG